MPSNMENVRFFLSRTFASIKVTQKSWPLCRDARSTYPTLIRNGWVLKLDHAAYLGKELTKAELSVRHHFDYLQDGA